MKGILTKWFGLGIVTLAVLTVISGCCALGRHAGQMGCGHGGHAQAEDPRGDEGHSGSHQH